MDPDRDLIDEQIAYYRARAGEYDATLDCRRATRSRPMRTASAPRSEPSRRAAGCWRLAAGTGQWTGLLAEFADELLVTDASPEMLELNRARVGERSNVRYHLADALSLSAARRYDVVFFGFWGDLPGSWHPPVASSSSTRPSTTLWEEAWIDREAGIVSRPLTDGSVHRAVKVLWRPDDLANRLGELGWDASVQGSGPFYWGSAIRR